MGVSRCVEGATARTSPATLCRSARRCRRACAQECGRMAERRIVAEPRSSVARRQHRGDEASRTPRVSSTAIAASVVPPGEVTLRRSSAGDSAEAAASAAEPASVCSARRRAARRAGPSGGRPRAAPRAAGTRRPGPEPESAVTASSAASSPTQTSSPVGREQRLRHRPGLRRSRPAARTAPAMPWPISAGVLGIARTTRSLPVAAAMASLRTPAITLRWSAAPTCGAARRGRGLERLRLDRPDDDVGRRQRRPARRSRLDAEAADQTGAAFPRSARRRRSRRPAGRP